NLLPWMARATVHSVRYNDNAMLDMDHFEQLLKLKPKVVAITHCSNVTGIYHPLEQMAKAAKAVGAIVVVDAAQSVPHRKVNVRSMDIDFLAFSAHKMAGPTGVGVLYGRKDMLESLTPTNLGGGMVDWVDSEHYRLRKIPHRFEAGTPNISGAYGLAASIDYLQVIGFDVLQKHDLEMGQFMLSLALERDYLKVVCPDVNAERGAVLSMTFPALENLDDVARVLSDSYGIMCRNGHLCAQPFVTDQAPGQVLRISTYIYNTRQDIQQFFDALDEISPMYFAQS
ncbi:MAG: cysteine desulfurase/selenocysteine lyase, partial [Phenylobacterium sp.]